MKKPARFQSAQTRTEFLIMRSQDGDECALNDLMGHVQPRIHSMVRRRMGLGLRSCVESSDIAQDVSLRVCRGVHRFRPQGEGSFNSWLRTVVANRVIDAARKQTRQPPLLFESASVAPNILGNGVAVDAFGQRENKKWVKELLLSLPANLRRIVEMKEFEGLTIKEIALQLGTSDMTVWRLHKSALARLLVNSHKLS